MYRHCGTNNRAPRWTFTDPCKPEVRPGAREESASPAWLAAPAMNARDTTKVYILRPDTGCGSTLYRKCHSHNTPGKRHNDTWIPFWINLLYLCYLLFYISTALLSFSSIFILQTFPSWVATSHLRPPMVFLSHNSSDTPWHAPLMHVLFWGRCDFPISFSGKDMPRNISNRL